ncbi:hypothetical protein BCO26_2579 [Heyndrickxia coagulans 2-6]|nr:hypothetical protein BCO26_2579 [Heyndrickxia coagulans 2-6]
MPAIVYSKLAEMPDVIKTLSIQTRKSAASTMNSILAAGMLGTGLASESGWMELTKRKAI